MVMFTHVRNVIKYSWLIKILVGTLLFLGIPISFVSCGAKSDSYRIIYKGGTVIVKNNKGSVSFPVIGEVNISGQCVDGVLLPGASLTMVASNDDKEQTVVFEHVSQDSSIQISTSTYYKRDCVIENDGIIGECKGDIGFIRDKNVFVCGTPVLVGYTNKNKDFFAICPEYGPLTPYYSKLEEECHYTRTIKAGETLTARLVIFNNEERPIRLLCQPDGHGATFTIAAHADRARSLVIRAILWGTSDTTSIDYGKKGMLSNGIVGTMSVFAKHTEQFRAAEALEVPYFKEIIDMAYLQGFEICPHTISFYPDNRTRFVQYLPLFEENYHCRNWIDHFLRKGIESSGLHSAGGDVESECYVMDLLQQYGYQYCWSYIDTPTQAEMPEDQIWAGHFMFPRHLVYQNEHLAFPDGTAIYQYKNSWEQLEKLVVNKDNDPISFMESIIDNCGVWTDHCYLIGEFDKLYEKDNSKGEYKIHPKLDSFFKYLGEKIKEDNVWNPTMSEFCDYMVNLEKVNIQRLSRGTYQIINEGNESLNCSFFYNGEGFITLNGRPMQSRQVKKGIIYYGEIKAGDDNYLKIEQ